MVLAHYLACNGDYFFIFIKDHALSLLQDIFFMKHCMLSMLSYTVFTWLQNTCRGWGRIQEILSMWTKMIMRKKRVKSNGCMFFYIFTNIIETNLLGVWVVCLYSPPPWCFVLFGKQWSCEGGRRATKELPKKNRGRTGCILILLAKTKGFFCPFSGSTLTRVN